jgi:hypothetical protein
MSLDRAHAKVAEAIEMLDATCRAKSDDAAACDAAHQRVQSAVSEYRKLSGIQPQAAKNIVLNKSDMEMLSYLAECAQNNFYETKVLGGRSCGSCPTTASGGVYHGWDPSWYYPSWYSYVLNSPTYWNYWYRAPYSWRSYYLDPWYWSRYY